jgi:hypothetical protein
MKAFLLWIYLYFKEPRTSLLEARYTRAQEAVETDNYNRIAVFSARYGSEVKCPICKRRQSSKDDKCQLCGCRFIFVENEKKTKKSNGLSSIFSSRKKAES